MDFKEMFESLSPEQREGFLACKNNDEVIAYARDAHIELPDDLLSDVAGGTSIFDDPVFYICPYCGHDNKNHIEFLYYSTHGKLVCQSCLRTWRPDQR